MTTITTGTEFLKPTKNDIITRLFKDGHINLEEVLLLAEKEVEHHYHQQYIPQPYQLNPWTVTCSGTSTDEKLK